MSGRKRIKTFVHGTCPYIWLKIFNPHSPKLNGYKYLKEHGYTHHPYDFAGKYLKASVIIEKDEARDLFYVKHSGNKKLYYPRGYTEKKIEGNYRALRIEQDINHGHHYLDSLDEVTGKVFLDIGSAEGMTSLDVIEKVKRVYLFEFEPGWVEALQATFEPWKGKVVIVNRYVGKSCTDLCITLDEFFKDKPKDSLFLKMDIEGAECEALEGADRLFQEATNFSFAICTYHRRNDEKQISAYLDRHNCSYSAREGYMYVKHRFRTALVYGGRD